jgi:hypothetical protein
MKALVRQRADDADGADREFFIEHKTEERRGGREHVVSVVSNVCSHKRAGHGPGPVERC